jgi:hypothetical protein
MHLGLLDAMPKTGIQRRRIMDFIYSLRDYSVHSRRLYRQGRVVANALDQAHRRLRNHLLGRQPS